MPCGTREIPGAIVAFVYGGITLYAGTFQTLQLATLVPVRVPQPRRYMYLRFGLFPGRSPLLGESQLISVPPGTEMFHFPGFALHGYEFTMQ